MKEKILQCASYSIQEYGLKKFKLEFICTKLKISKKTIYKYFKSKDEIAREYINTILDTDKNSSEGIASKDLPLKEKCNGIIHTYHKYKMPYFIIDEIKIYYEEEWRKFLALRRYKYDLLISILKEAKDKGQIKENVDLSITALIIDEMSKKLLDSELLKEHDINYNASVDAVFNIILNGILK